MANVIHNDLGVDPALAPATLFLGLLLIRRNWALLLAAAVMIALPLFLFLRLSELTAPTGVRHFVNHLALLLAGVFAVMAAVVAVTKGRCRVLQP